MMNAKQSVILMEFNELSPILMQRFMQEGKLPNFQRLHGEAQVYTTDAEEQPPYLNPWIQWITVHSGMPYSEHQIFHLGDGHKLKKKCIWDVANDAGLKSWVCGAMNVRFDAPMNGWVLPDPWTVGARPFPDTLDPYFRFVQAHVQEHTNERVPLKASDYLGFVQFMLRHGLSAATVWATLKQLLSERFKKAHWKRAAIMDKLQFDVFRWYYRRERPDFSAFFLNSTAHFQHMHWREFEPDRFKVKPSAEDRRRYSNAILFGYQQMDGLVKRFCDLVDENTALIFVTGFSQQACLAYEDQGGKSFYRPRDLAQFVKFAGVTAPFTVSPVMSEQFHIFFQDEEETRKALETLESLRVNDKAALELERKGKTIFAGCNIFEALPRDAVLKIGREGRSAPFLEVFYQVEGMKSGMHHPEGMLWIRRPGRAHRVHSQKVSLTSIAPTVLNILGLPRPDYMRGSPLDSGPSQEGRAGRVPAMAQA
jgi:hypothetical protein